MVGERHCPSRVGDLSPGGMVGKATVGGRRRERWEFRVRLLRNKVRPYAWGSRTVIAELQGRPVPTPHPEAELWMGAHPDASSSVLDADGVERSLLELIKTDPAGQLGAAYAQRWANRLPFLLKVLAADEPMS